MSRRFLVGAVVVFFLLSLCPAPRDAAQRTPGKGLSDEQIEFVEKALARLSGSQKTLTAKGMHVDVTPVESAAESPAAVAPSNTATSPDAAAATHPMGVRRTLRGLYAELRAAEEVAWEQWVELTDLIARAAYDRNVRSEVTISTHREGAQIKYQLVGDRLARKPPLTISEPTTCVEKMLIGQYYIWAERGGRPTSSMTAQFRIVDERVKLRLVESRR